MSRKTMFRIFALLVGSAAIYHALALAAPGLAIPGPRWRHGLFVVIDLVFAVLLVRRPPWLVVPFALLTFYSLYSHGSHAWLMWHIEGRVDWLSGGVILMMPIMLAALVRDLPHRGDCSER